MEGENKTGAAKTAPMKPMAGCEDLVKALHERKMLALSGRILEARTEIMKLSARMDQIGERIDAAIERAEKHQADIERQIERLADMMMQNDALAEEIKAAGAKITINGNVLDEEAVARILTLAKTQVGGE